MPEESKAWVREFSKCPACGGESRMFEQMGQEIKGRGLACRPWPTPMVIEEVKMPKKSALATTTTMYSIHKETGAVVIHHLPWPKGNPQLEHYVEKGFTYERPVEKPVGTTPAPANPVAVAGRIPCPGCGKPCHPQGLKAHQRTCPKCQPVKA
jgi:hypothetical protein